MVRHIEGIKEGVLQVICDVEWIGQERVIEKSLQEAKKGVDISVGRIDRHRFTIICGEDSGEEEKFEGYTVSIMGRKFPSFDSIKPRNFLYIGNHEGFLNTLSLNLGSEV